MRVVDRLDRANAPRPAGLGIQLVRLARLHAELALTEVRRPLIAACTAVAVGVLAACAGVAGMVVLIAAALAPFFAAPWQHLAIAGGGVLLVSGLAIAWSAWRLRRLALPRDTLRSLTENWEWLVVQVKSKLTLR